MRWPRLRLRQPEPDRRLGWHWFGTPAERHLVLLNPLTRLPAPVCGSRAPARDDIVRADTTAFDCAECSAYYSEVYLPQLA